MTRLRGSAAIIIGITSLSILAFLAVALSALPADAQSTVPICSVQENLQPGSTGADVTTLQAFLSTQGDFTVAPTGYFGPVTKAALVQFQNTTGITAQAGGNGVFGPFTRNYIATNFCSSGSSGSTTNSSSTTYYGPTTNGTFNGELTASPTSGNAPLTVTFSGVGSSIAFGDNTGQTNSAGAALGVISHTYTTAGTYVASSNGLSTIVTVVTSAANGGTSSPAGSINTFTNSGAAPLAVTFYVSCTNAGTYDVQFGDGSDLGSSAAQAQCNGDLQTVTHTYQTDGSFTATLELLVQGSNGTYSSQSAGSVNIQVGLSNTSNTVSFISSPSTGVAPLTVNFSGNAPYPYQIQPGDTGPVITSPVITCSSSTNCPPAFTSITGSHTYNTAGTYYALLATSSTAANLATSTITVTAGATNCAPTQDLQLGDSDSDTNGQVSVLQTFLVSQGKTIYPADIVTGFFGNGTQTGVRNFQAKYGIEQTGTVGPLTIAAMTTVCKGGTPTPPAAASFSASPQSGNPPLSVTFTASNFETPASGSSYVVDFGDGNKGTTSSSGSLTSTHTYPNSGTYTASLDLEQNLCGGGLTTFGCVSDLQEGSATITVGSGVSTTSTSPNPTSGSFNTYYTFNGGYGANFNSTNQNEPAAEAWYCTGSGSGVPAASTPGCSQGVPSSTISLFSTQQSGTIPLYEMAPSGGTCVATAISPYSCTVVTPSSTQSSVCPTGFAVGSSQCPLPNGAPGNTLGYVYPKQFAGTVPLYSLENSCSETYFMSTSPSSAPQDTTGGCGVANVLVGVIGYIPLPTAP